MFVLRCWLGDFVGLSWAHSHHCIQIAHCLRVELSGENWGGGASLSPCGFSLSNRLDCSCSQIWRQWRQKLQRLLRFRIRCHTTSLLPHATGYSKSQRQLDSRIQENSSPPADWWQCPTAQWCACREGGPLKPCLQSVTPASNHKSSIFFSSTKYTHFHPEISKNSYPIV